MGDPVIRFIVYWGLYLGTLILGNHHMGFPDIRRRLLGCILEFTLAPPMYKKTSVGMSPRFLGNVHSLLSSGHACASHLV